MNKDMEPQMIPAGYAVYIADSKGTFREVPPHWRYPSEEHARRVAYQQLQQKGVSVEIVYFPEGEDGHAVEEGKVVERADPGNAELMETIAREYPQEPDARELDERDMNAQAKREARKEMAALQGEASAMSDTGPRKWSVWSEGFSATGDRSGAQFHGRWSGETFKDAVEAYIASLPENERGSYDAERMTYWGCHFFDNQEDARRSFG